MWYRFLDWADALPWDNIVPIFIGSVIMIGGTIVVIMYYIDKHKRG